MDAFLQSGFGRFLQAHFSTFFRASNWQSFLYLAYGWSVCQYHQTIAQYIWLSGGTQSKHFTRYYHFLNLSFLGRLDQLWACVWGLIDSMIGQETILQLVIDDTTRKKSGRKIQGAAYFRNGAGTARQEYRSLWGLNFVYLSLSWSWRGHRLSLPMGLRIYLKPAIAAKLGREFDSRSALARQILDFIALNLPHRTFLVLIDGGYATKEFLRKLPSNVEVLGRFPISSKLYEMPPARGAKPKVGRPPLKGSCLNSPQRMERDSGTVGKNIPTILNCSSGQYRESGIRSCREFPLWSLPFGERTNKAPALDKKTSKPSSLPIY